jgi:phosphoribosylformimino-5-aminoimidazole carboxamide ribotide isomerase
MSMKLFPAIDILDGRAVRLMYGKKEEVTDYGLPMERAKMWIDAGAEYLHVVDLSGAFDGVSRINDEIERIAALGVKVQSGGGLRTMSAITDRLNAGASRVILGTVCLTDPELFQKAVDKYGDAIVAGIDCKNGFLSVKGWTETGKETGVSFGQRAKKMGVNYCVFTDVSRDGALKGVAADETATLGQETGLNVIASGGIASMTDLEDLDARGVYGAILGRAIYAGKIDLAEAVSRFGGERNAL